jgi:hypothetical protein
LVLPAFYVRKTPKKPPRLSERTDVVGSIAALVNCVSGNVPNARDLGLTTAEGILGGEVQERVGQTARESKRIGIRRALHGLVDGRDSDLKRAVRSLAGAAFDVGSAVNRLTEDVRATNSVVRRAQARLVNAGATPRPHDGVRGLLRSATILQTLAYVLVDMAAIGNALVMLDEEIRRECLTAASKRQFNRERFACERRDSRRPDAAGDRVVCHDSFRTLNRYRRIVADGENVDVRRAVKDPKVLSRDTSDGRAARCEDGLEVGSW